MKNGNGKIYLTIALTLAITIGGGLVTWGQVQEKISDVEEDVKELQDDQKETVNKEEFDEVKQDVKVLIVQSAKMETKQESMDDKLDRILEKLDP